MMHLDNLKQPDFGRRILALRRQKGLTQSELAQRAEITRQHLGLIENGTANPKLSTVWMLALALDVTVRQVFSEDDDAMLSG